MGYFSVFVCFTIIRELRIMCIENILKNKKIGLDFIRNRNVMLFHYVADNLFINEYYLLEPSTVVLILVAFCK